VSMRLSPQTIAAPAKINLFLQVTGRRPDGYHELVSLMQKLRLADTLVVQLIDGGVSLTCSDPDLPVDESNLAWRAAHHFFRETGCRCGATISLEKKIPVAAGLGGGSSDAASVLLALNHLCDSCLTEDELADLGFPLGADVPFFVRAAPAALARGIGERLTPAHCLHPGPVLLVNPGFPVSTKWAYENLALTSEGNPYILAPDSAYLNNGYFGSGSIDIEAAGVSFFVNDLESVTIARYPEIGRIKESLLAFGARVALMSGSGPTVFGLFVQEHEAQAAFRHFRAIYSDSVFLTEPRSA
jgi:4-diphosphocytidyl-2-C-methyl-D-erythritol kinase